MFKKIKEFIKAFKDAYNTINVNKIDAKKAIDDYSMEITKDKLEEICITLTEQLNLNKQGLHIAAIFQDNSNDEIIGWGICDSNNNICISYDDLEVLYNTYNK